MLYCFSGMQLHCGHGVSSWIVERENRLVTQKLPQLCSELSVLFIIIVLFFGGGEGEGGDQGGQWLFIFSLFFSVIFLGGGRGGGSSDFIILKLCLV